MKKFFITKRKAENNVRCIKVYKIGKEPLFCGFIDVKIDRESEIQKAFELLIKKGFISKKYNGKNYYECCDKYKIIELPY